MPVDIYTDTFQYESVLAIPLGGYLVSFLLSGVQIYFHFRSLAGYLRIESEKLKKSHFGQIQLQFEVCSFILGSYL